MREVEHDEWENLDPAEKDIFLLVAYLRSDDGKAYLAELNMTFEEAADQDYNPSIDEQYLSEYLPFLEAELKKTQTQERIKKLILKKREEEKKLTVERDLALLFYKAANDPEYRKIMAELVGQFLAKYKG